MFCVRLNLIGLLVLSAATCAFAEEKPVPIVVAPMARTTNVDFETEILPLFRASCLACHNRTTSKSDLILETPQTILKGGENGPAVVPGKPDESLLLISASHRTKPLMPPRDNKAQAKDFTPEQLALIQLWISQGAKGEVHAATIEWHQIARAFTPTYAAAVTFDGQFAAAGRANQLHLYQLASQRLLAPLCDPTLSSIGQIAHRDMVYSLAFSPDGTRLASGSFGEVKIWRRSEPTAKSTINLPGLAIAASANGKWLAIAGDKQQVDLIDASNGNVAKTLEGHTAQVRVMRFSPDDSLLACVSEKSIRVWNVAEGKSVADVSTPADIQSLVWTHGGKRLATGHADNIIRPFTLAEAALTPGPEMKGHTGPVTSLDAIAPGNQLLSGSTDGTVRIWNLDSGQSTKQLPHGSPIAAVAARPDGKFFASAGENGIIKLWDVAKPTAVEIKGDPSLAFVAAQRDADQKLAVADVAYFQSVVVKTKADQKAQEDRVKKAADAKVAAEKPIADKKVVLDKAVEAKSEAEKVLARVSATTPSTAPTTQTALKPEAQKAAIKDATDKLAVATKALKDAQVVYAATELARSNAINEADLAAAAVVRVVKEVATSEAAVAAAQEKQKAADAALAAAKQTAGVLKPVRAIAFSADNTTLATSGDDQKIRLWSAESGASLRTIDSPSPATALAFNASGILLAGLADHHAVLWDLPTNWTLERTIGSGDANSPLADRVNALAFSPAGHILATGAGEPSRGGQLKFWDPATGNLLHDFGPAAHSDAILCLDFSRDGTRLASGASDRFVKVFDVAAKKMLLSLEGHTHHILGVSFRADGRTLVSSGADAQVKLWDLVAGERKGNPAPFAKEVTSIHYFGVTDQFIATCADGQLRIMNDGGGQVRAFNGPADHLHTSAISWSGDTFLAAGQSGSLYLWDTAAGKLLATLAPPEAAPKP